jgi:hypothetical protein
MILLYNLLFGQFNPLRDVKGFTPSVKGLTENGVPRSYDENVTMGSREVGLFNTLTVRGMRP